MPRKNRGRKRGKTGKVEKEYCQGYLDKNGIWNNGFYCIKFTKKPKTKFCCGDQFFRFCCKPPGEGTTKTSTEHIERSNRNIYIHIASRTRPATHLSPTTVTRSLNDSLIDIPLIAGAAAGGLVVIIFLIILSCCICPCCPNKRRQRQRKKMMVQENMFMKGCSNQFLLESRDTEADVCLRDGALSETDTVSSAMIYPKSNTPTSQTSLPSSNVVHDNSVHTMLSRVTDKSPGQTRLPPYKGVMVTNYQMNGDPCQPDLLHTLKPITFGHLIPDMYPNEEIDPFTLTSGYGTLDYSGHLITSNSHGRMMRPALNQSPLSHLSSPTSTFRGQLHANRYAF